MSPNERPDEPQRRRDQARPYRTQSPVPIIQEHLASTGASRQAARYSYRLFSWTGGHTSTNEENLIDVARGNSI